jgi:competence protein ComEC
MTWAIWAFAFGTYWLQQQAQAPASDFLLALGAAGVVLMAIAGYRPVHRLRVLVPVGAFLLGIALAGWQAQVRLDDALAEDNEGQDLVLVGVIAELPQRSDNGLRFSFAVEQAGPGIPQRISLAWYSGFRQAEQSEPGELGKVPDLRSGQRWHLTVRLKRPHGNMNPHGFDYEAALFERGVRATGYVRADSSNAMLDEFVLAPGYAVERLRQVLRDRMLAALPEQSYIGVLIALAVGDQRAIDSGMRQTIPDLEQLLTC